MNIEKLKILLRDCKESLEHIVQSEEWETLQHSSSAEDLIEEIEVAL